MIKKAKEKEYAGDAGAGCACRYGYTKPDDYPSCMYDEETGLPSFNLFEDRLKMALINERVKDLRMRKLKIAVVGIYIENLADFSSPSFRAAVFRQTAELLTGTLPQNYTVARGINYPFWIMMPYLSTREDAEVWVDKIQTALGRKMPFAGKNTS